MTWLDYCADNQIVLTASQVWAMHWLTWRGKRFMVDFGYANCEQLADLDLLLVRKN